MNANRGLRRLLRKRTADSRELKRLLKLQKIGLTTTIQTQCNGLAPNDDTYVHCTTPRGCQPFYATESPHIRWNAGRCIEDFRLSTTDIIPIFSPFFVRGIFFTQSPRAGGGDDLISIALDLQR